MLKQRLITAFTLLIPVLAAIFFLPNTIFSMVMAIVILIAGWEWANLSELSTNWQRFSFLGILAATMLCLFLLMQNYTILKTVIIVLLLAVLFWLYALFRVVMLPQKSLGVAWQKALYGFVVLIPAWLALVWLHHLPQGSIHVLILLLCIWIADTGAYFSGKKWGKNKLAPLVSPGKSWEGVLGGVVLTGVFGLALSLFYYHSLFALILIVLVVLFSVLGDLLESLFKRQAGLKDSGKLLPGHGGILDRIDSLTAAAPIFTLGLLFLEGYRL